MLIPREVHDRKTIESKMIDTTCDRQLPASPPYQLSPPTQIGGYTHNLLFYADQTSLLKIPMKAWKNQKHQHFNSKLIEHE